MIELLSAIAAILLVDLVLSGDNALVIGAAAAGLPRRQRWIAIFFGGAGAAVLRIVFAFIASCLLALPWLQAIGGLILLITMSLDNVLAVGALSHGNMLALSIGILVSIAVLLVGSALVAELMK